MTIDSGLPQAHSAFVYSLAATKHKIARDCEITSVTKNDNYEFGSSQRNMLVSETNSVSRRARKVCWLVDAV